MKIDTNIWIVIDYAETPNDIYAFTSISAILKWFVAELGVHTTEREIFNEFEKINDDEYSWSTFRIVKMPLFAI